MKQHLFICLSICIFLSSCKGDEKLAIAGSGWDEIAIINKKTAEMEWKHKLLPNEECNAVEVTDKGNVLYAYKNGARLINRNHEVIWDYAAKEGEEIHSASQLKDGGFLIGVCGQPARIVELDRDGRQRNEITFNTVIFDTHQQFRQIIKTDSNIYLVPLMEKQKVLQLTTEGKNRKNVFLGYELFSVKMLPGNNWLVSCGNSRCFAVLNPKGNLLEEGNLYITDKVSGASLQFVGEIIPYKNGHALIANGKLSDSNTSSPLLVEINKNKDVVWTLPYNKEIKNITAVYSFFE